MGSVIFLSQDEKQKMGETELKLASVQRDSLENRWHKKVMVLENLEITRFSGDLKTLKKFEKFEKVLAFSGIMPYNNIRWLTKHNNTDT